MPRTKSKRSAETSFTESKYSLNKEGGYFITSGTAKGAKDSNGDSGKKRARVAVGDKGIARAVKDVKRRSSTGNRTGYSSTSKSK